MKLYLAAGTYVGTQADARKLDRDFQPVDVPTDKEGLIAYLNRITEKTEWLKAPQVEEGVMDPPETPYTHRVQTELPATNLRPEPISTETDAIVEHILDHASQAQIERIGLALFARVGEATRAVRVLS